MEHTVTPQFMEALRVLSETTLKISEAKNSLIKLEETETEYLVERERKALAVIARNLEDSKSLVEEINKNYELISDYSKNIAEGAGFLEATYQKFKALVEDFDKRQAAFERDCENQKETIVSLRKGIKIEIAEVESGKRQNEKVRTELMALSKKIEDDRGVVNRAIERLKDNRI